jgi:hypothetical protein
MAIKTQGTVLRRNGVAVAELTGFDGPTKVTNFIEVTHMGSTGKEFLGGLADPGSMTFSGWFNPTDPAQLAIRADQDAQTSSTYTLTLSDGSVMTLVAFVEEFTISGAPDQGVALNLALRISGNPTWS